MGLMLNQPVARHGWKDVAAGQQLEELEGNCTHQSLLPGVIQAGRGRWRITQGPVQRNQILSVLNRGIAARIPFCTCSSSNEHSHM